MGPASLKVLEDGLGHFLAGAFLFKDLVASLGYLFTQVRIVPEFKYPFGQNRF